MVHVNLQILYKCNFRCQICDFWHEPHKDMPHLPLEHVRVIAKKLRALGPQLVSIGGGEPLLHPELVEITECLAKDNFPMMICNGWYVTPENARALFQAGMHEVSVSVDYASAEKHDEQRGMKGAFDRAVNALRILVESRTSPAQRVHMISVVMDDNLEDIELLIHLAKEIGVTYLVTLYSSGRGQKQSRAQVKEISSHLLELRRKYSDFVSLPGYLKQFQRAMNDQQGVFPCYAGKNLFNIDCQGNVTLCIDSLEDPVANMLTDDITYIRRKLLERYRANSCGKCWTSCRGSIETLMYGKGRLYNALKSYQVVKKVPIQRSA
jgi:MoaA/NifB/PqqE/SkfB family radical SAM enzyme